MAKKVENENEKFSINTSLNVKVSDALEKVNSAPVLNGGFETRIFKIDKIEESQGQIASKVDSIHDAIYNPDDGLFARINTNKGDAEKTAITVEHRITELEKFRLTAFAAVKWTVVALTGGILSLLFKLIYTIVTGKG